MNRRGSNIFDRKIIFLYRNSYRCSQTDEGQSEKRSEQNGEERTRKSYFTNVLFMMRDPQKEQKYRTNVINVMTSNLFYLLFVFIFHFFDRTLSLPLFERDLNTENFLNCGDKSGPIECNERERESL